MLYCVLGKGHGFDPGLVLADVPAPLVSVLQASVKTWHDSALWFDSCCSSGTSNAGVVLGWGLRKSAAGHVMGKKGKN